MYGGVLSLIWWTRLVLIPYQCPHWDLKISWWPEYNVNHWIGYLPNLHQSSLISTTLSSQHLTMPPTKTNWFSWMGSAAPRIQVGHPQGSNPDGCQQAAHQSAQEQGETPFYFNQFGHEVWNIYDKVFSSTTYFNNLIVTPLRGTCLLRQSLIIVGLLMNRKCSGTSGGTTSSKLCPRLEGRPCSI